MESTNNINKFDICIVVPCYNEEECINAFSETTTKEITEGNSNIRPYFLFINDGSVDATLSKIKELSKANNNVGYVSLSRNFGKESAIYAGLETAYNKVDTKYYVLMDADLQHPPSVIPQMYDKLSNNSEYSRIGTKRTKRNGEPHLRSVMSKLFYKIMNKASQVDIAPSAMDFQMMTKKYVSAILKCGEYNRFFKGLSEWVGYKTDWIEIETHDRKQGKTSWSFFGLLNYSVEGLVAFTTWPLKIISVIGILLSLAAGIYLIYVIIKALLMGDPVSGWPTLACLLLIIGGLLMVSMGILGLYFEKTYTEVKNRPIYLVDEEEL